MRIWADILAHRTMVVPHWQVRVSHVDRIIVSTSVTNSNGRDRTLLTRSEIFPLFVRAKGGAVSVLGWSIGNGVVTEITPFLFNAM